MHAVVWRQLARSELNGAGATVPDEAIAPVIMRAFMIRRAMENLELLVSGCVLSRSACRRV
jgi:hypothetical protein